MSTSGYSGVPLIKKLEIKDGFQVYLVNTPQNYSDLLPDLPEINLIKNPQKDSADFVHLFCTTTHEFEEQSLKLKPLLKTTGMLWVSWPKGSSKIETDLSRDQIRDFLLINGLVDIKVCAVDADWSGLKFVYRLKDR